MADQQPRIDLANRLALSIVEAAVVLGVSENTFRAAVIPEIEKVFVGRRVLIPVAALQQWLADHAEREVGADSEMLDELLAGVE